ncbi:MAG: hypothetical protein WBB25_18635 [Sulfitobacter sp.]
MSAMVLMGLLTITMFLPIFEDFGDQDEDVDPANPAEPVEPGSVLEGTAGPDELSAGGNDTLNGGAGDDVLGVEANANGAEVNGGDGNDTLTGGGVFSTLNGDAGVDVLSDAGAEGAVLNGGEGGDIIELTGTGNITNGDSGQDVITLAGGNTANGGDGDDTITASGGADGAIAVLNGGGGEDVLIEGTSDSGAPLVFQANGGAGNDTLQVQLDLAGQVDETTDVLSGGTRGDTFMLDLISGEGTEEGLITGVRITDFDPEEDTLIIDTANIDGQDTDPPAFTFGDYTLNEAANASYTDVLIDAVQLIGGAQSVVTVRLLGVSGIDTADITLLA